MPQTDDGRTTDGRTTDEFWFHELCWHSQAELKMFGQWGKRTKICTFGIQPGVFAHIMSVTLFVKPTPNQSVPTSGCISSPLIHHALLHMTCITMITEKRIYRCIFKVTVCMYLFSILGLVSDTIKCSCRLKSGRQQIYMSESSLHCMMRCPCVPQLALSSNTALSLRSFSLTEKNSVMHNMHGQ